MNNKKYTTMYLEGVSHNIATIYYDEDRKVVTYLVGSFLSRQLFDNCLAVFQKGSSFTSEGEYLHTDKKGYIGKFARAKDENTCDGVHAVIYNTNPKYMRIYQEDNEIDKVYDWLEDNLKTGILPEWKTYLYNKLKEKGLIKFCEGIDLTGKAPRILILSNDINTELIRSIKTEGLKRGEIDLPVEEVESIPEDISFLDIINNKIIPYIQDIKCQYNIGDEISPILEDEFIKDGKRGKLFPRQVVIAQGLVNAVKNGVNFPILNGGMGVGKTMIGLYVSYALIKEYLKKDNARIGIFLQSHLHKKWIREAESVLGHKEKITFHTLEKFTDVKKLSKKPKGLEILIFPKDRVKRSYLIEHSTSPKYRTLEKANKLLTKLYKKVYTEGNVYMAEVDSMKYMKYIALNMEQQLDKRIVLYTPYYDEDKSLKGYHIVTTSEVLKNKMNGVVKNMNYHIDFVGGLQELRDALKDLDSEIKNEEIKRRNPIIENPYVCPHCGGYIYEKSLDLFDFEDGQNFQYKEFKNINETNKKCSSFVKADGTSLTMQEVDYIRRGVTNFKIVTGKYKNAYVTDEGEPITGAELIKRKCSPRGITILLKRCDTKVVGYKEQTGYRTFDVTKYMDKILGKKCIDVTLYDEAHLLAAQSNQGNAFANLCRLSKVNIPLTGTLTSGRASDIFYFLYRLSPQLMKENGYEYSDLNLFVDHYGRRKKETVEYEATYNKSGRKTTSGWKELPGISPLLYSTFLVNTMCSRKIEDLGIELPPIKYFKNEVDMGEELTKNYFKLKDEFIRFIKAMKGVSIGGSYIHSLISYPDMPVQEPVSVNINGISTVIAEPTVMEIEDKLLPKEVKLIETCTKELAEGRRVLLYATYTGDKGVSKRLIKVLSNKFKVAELTSKVKLEKREQWIQDRYDEGVEILITNPENVATGLDIIQYPTIYFYEIPCNTKTFRQAERRGYRPCMKHEVRIYYSYYKNSIQEEVIMLQGQKKACSLALEGVYDESLLTQMSNGGDSIESQLNKVLQGKIKLKESDLDVFNFAEEVEFKFEENENGNVDVTKTSIISETVEITSEELNLIDLITINEAFLMAKGKKRKSKIVEGQLGFVI